MQITRKLSIESECDVCHVYWIGTRIPKHDIEDEYMCLIVVDRMIKNLNYIVDKKLTSGVNPFYVGNRSRLNPYPRSEPRKCRRPRED